MTCVGGCVTTGSMVAVAQSSTVVGTMVEVVVSAPAGAS